MIVGDIGGTKTLLAMVSENGQRPDFKHIKRYTNNEHDCFDGILANYLMEAGTEKPTTLSLSVAGPVKNNHCILTNLPWEIHTDKLASEFNIANVFLLNDLAATANSVPYLLDEDLAWLQHPNHSASGRNAGDTTSVISAGTGLGEATLLYTGPENEYIVVPGEGGHKNFAPNSDEELELLMFYLKQQPHVSVEMLVSGMGLQRIYQFLEQHPDWENQIPVLSDADNGKVRNELISQLAYELPDSIYAKTVTLFCRMLMSEAGNLALQTYSSGGVVIAGGIAPAVLQFLQAESSLAAFYNKSRFKDWLSTLPVRVCLNTNAPMIGAWAFGRQQNS